MDGGLCSTEAGKYQKNISENFLDGSLSRTKNWGMRTQLPWLDTDTFMERAKSIADRGH
jgi:hypothetical protein